MSRKINSGNLTVNTPTLSSLLGPSIPRILTDKSSENRVLASAQIESLIRSLRSNSSTAPSPQDALSASASIPLPTHSITQEASLITLGRSHGSRESNENHSSLHTAADGKRGSSSNPHSIIRVDKFFPAETTPTAPTPHSESEENGESDKRLPVASLISSFHFGANEGSPVSMTPVTPLESVSGENALQQILTAFKLELLRHPSPFYRKGGLLGLASIAIGLDDELKVYFKEIAFPIMECLSDVDARVRYSACEALYNVVKIANATAIEYINELFNGLCKASLICIELSLNLAVHELTLCYLFAYKLSADVEQDVRNGAQYLNRLVKEIITESSHFKLSPLVPLLGERSKGSNPFVRQLVLSWITMLDSFPDFDMISQLPWFLQGLFFMLTDANRDIRQSADACLTEYLRRIKLAFDSVQPIVVQDIGKIVIKLCRGSDKLCRLTALVWIHEFVLQGSQCSSFRMLYPEVISSVLYCVADDEEEIAKLANETHNELLYEVANTEITFNIVDLTGTLIEKLNGNAVIVKIRCLQWLNILLSKGKDRMQDYIEVLLESSLLCLKSSDYELGAAALSLIGQISRCFLDILFYPNLCKRLLKLFAEDRELLEARGLVILSKLCGHVDVKLLYSTFAKTIDEIEDLEYSHQVVQVLNWILLTAVETKAFRLGLKHDDSKLFEKLLICWFHNPVSAVSLCLWGEEYQIAYEIICALASLDVTLYFMKQLDQLVHLIESPIFACVRMHLLEPTKYPALVKALMGLCMLMPRKDNCQTLYDRLQFVTSALQLDATNRSYERTDAIHAKNSKRIAASSCDMETILMRFQDTVAKHNDFISTKELATASRVSEILLQSHTD